MALEAGRSSYAIGMSLSTTGTGRDSPVVFAPNNEAEEWSREWASVLARGASSGCVVLEIVNVHDTTFPNCTHCFCCFCFNSGTLDLHGGGDIKDLIDGPVIEIASDAKVEQACDVSEIPIHRSQRWHEEGRKGQMKMCTKRQSVPVPPASESGLSSIMILVAFY